MKAATVEPTGRMRNLFEYPAPTMRLDGLSLQPAGALVVAILAYPGVAEHEVRARAAYRLLARCRQILLSEEGAQPAAKGDAPLMSHREMDGGLKALNARIRRRVDVGFLALQPLVAADRGERPSRTRGGRWNRRAAVESACQASGLGDAKTFEYRQWDTSAAVIHIAAAWAGMLRAAHLRREPQEQVDRLLTDEAYLRELVQKAERMEALIEKSDLAIPSEILIKFRL